MSDSGYTAARVEAVVTGVIRAAVADAAAHGVMVLEATTPEGALLCQWLRTSLGEDSVSVVEPADRWPVPEGLVESASARREAERAAARVIARDRRLLLAHPVCKTVLLLTGSPPPEPILPFGDLYGSAVLELAGGCTLPDDVAVLADAAGELENLDRALSLWLESRRPLGEALAQLPAAARTGVAAALRANRSGRRWPRRVPKLSTRTLWIDVFA